MKKTHVNDTMIPLLRSLPRANRLERNEQIKLRNQERQIGRAYRESDPLRNYDGERYSSDESLCTITDDDEGNTPASSTALSSLWLTRFRKRERDDDPNDNDANSDFQRDRKRHANNRAEVAPENRVPGFNKLHYELFCADSYIPLSLFTNANLRTIAREASTLPMIKVYPHYNKGKVYILDIPKFESEHGSEEGLTYLQWVQASENYIRFVESYSDGAHTTRWKNHFDFLRRRVDSIEDFPAVIALDIRFRKDYVPQPFAFSTALYNYELEKTINSIQLQNLKKLSRTENKSVRRNKKFKRSNFS